tara:strand:- start:1103 stop:1594 length:492 start_codon:yes stop_codon:yes gene_type:complete
MSDLKQLIQMSTEIETSAIDGIEQEPLNIELSNPDSVEAYQFISQNLEQRSEYYKAQADELYKIAKTIENVSKRYDAFVKKVMVDSGVDEIHGKTFRFKLTSVKPKMVVDDEAALMATYSKTKTEVVLDKERAKQDLELGVPVDGAHLEQSYSLRKYPIKGLK